MGCRENFISLKILNILLVCMNSGGLVSSDRCYKSSTGYQYNDIGINVSNFSSLVFQIQGCQFAALNLASSWPIYSDTNEMPEVIFGGYNDIKRITVRSKIDGGNETYYEHTEPILDCYSKRWFWVDWSFNLIRVGFGNNPGVNSALTVWRVSNDRFKLVQISAGNISNPIIWKFPEMYFEGLPVKTNFIRVSSYPERYRCFVANQQRTPLTTGANLTGRTSMTFGVRSQSDAILDLTQRNNFYGSGMFELSLGKFRDKVTTLGRQYDGMGYLYNFESVLNYDRVTWFWVSWRKGIFSIGSGNVTRRERIASYICSSWKFEVETMHIRTSDTVTHAPWVIPIKYYKSGYSRLSNEIDCSLLNTPSNTNPIDIEVDCRLYPDEYQSKLSILVVDKYDIYVDGEMMVSSAQYDVKANETHHIILNNDTRLVAVMANRTSSRCGGILASVGQDEFITNSSWRCSAVYPGDTWMTLDFDDSSWPSATEIGKNDGANWCGWSQAAYISPTASWIWTHRWNVSSSSGIDHQVYCRGWVTIREEQICGYHYSPKSNFLKLVCWVKTIYG